LKILENLSKLSPTKVKIKI